MKIKIYPTIVHDRLYISNTTNKDIDIVIYNISGQQMTVPIDRDFIDVKQLNDGFYFLKINQGKGSKTFKIIKN